MSFMLLYPSSHTFSLLCHCHKKTIEQDFVAISITFYGECYGTKDRQRLAIFLKDAANQRSSCYDNKYGNCQDTSSLDCTGDDKTQYIYLVQAKYGKLKHHALKLFLDFQSSKFNPFIPLTTRLDDLVC